MGVIGLLLILWGGYALTGQPVALVINDQTYQVRTHRLTVEAVLLEFGVTPAPEDIVDPPIGAQLSPNQVITVRLARPAIVEADGRTRQLLTHQQTVAGVLAEVGIISNARDEILINGTIGAQQSPLPTAPVIASAPQAVDAASLLLLARTPRGAITSARPELVHLIVHRAIPVTLNDGGVSSTFYTTQPNVGEALLEQGLTLYLGDKVTPNLGTRLSPGMRIYIQRSTPVTIVADGRTVKTRTRRETVGEVLAKEGIALMGQDYSRPSTDHLISADDTIEVVRVRESLEIEQEFIPFETNWVPDAEMDLDRQELRQQGATGVIKTRTRIRYENGQQVARQVEDEWLDQEPNNRMIAYGTKITVRTLETEAGSIEYWRKISMLATPYSAATSGKDPDHPRYGITRSGLPAGYGIVAVDPKVIPLMTDLYIPGYGQALAADTGGLILGKHIDLGFDEDQPLPDLYEWRDVYVLTPIPPADKIRYVLPNWPQRP
jgi:uncharacterized protein YabE (DUF348 family)